MRKDAAAANTGEVGAIVSRLQAEHRLAGWVQQGDAVRPFVLLAHAELVALGAKLQRKALRAAQAWIVVSCDGSRWPPAPGWPCSRLWSAPPWILRKLDSSMLV